MMTRESIQSQSRHAVTPYLVRLYVEVRHLLFEMLQNRSIPPQEPFPVDRVRVEETITRIKTLLERDEHLDFCRRRFEKYFPVDLAYILGLAKREPSGNVIRIEAAEELRSVLLGYISRHGVDWNGATLDEVDQEAIGSLRESSRLQQQVAYLANYTPNKWLLEQEIPFIERSRAHRLPHSDRSTGSNPDPSAECGRPETTLSYKTGEDPYLWSRDHARLSGICLSGGGIRSATFNLGVLQGLAKRDFLRRFDYCSSVSGGGYIHQWLAAWIRREDDANSRFDKAVSGISAVTQELIPLPDLGCGPVHPEAIRWLRRYSNYLTPKKGVFSADSWVTIAIWLRNTFLNQLILLSMLFVAVLAPRLFLLKGALSKGGLAAAQAGTQPFSILNDNTIGVGILLGASVSLVTLLWMLRKALQAAQQTDSSASVKNNPEERFDAAQVAWLIVLPALILAMILSLFGLYFDLVHEPKRTIGLCVFTFVGMFLVNLVVAWYGGAPQRRMRVGLPFHFRQKLGYVLAATFAALLATGGILLCRNLFVSGSPAHFHSRTSRVQTQAYSADHASFSPLSSSISIAASRPESNGGYRFFAWPAPEDDLRWRCVVAFGPLLIMLVHFLSIILVCGLIGPDLEDWTLEWLARVRAMITLYSLLWTAICGISFFGRWMVEFLVLGSSSWIRWPVVLAWLGTTAGSVIAGRSSLSSGAGNDKGSGTMKALIIVGPYMYMLGTLLILAWFGEKAIEGVDLLTTGNKWAQYSAMGAIAILPMMIAFLFGKRVSINQFSMHSYYRNRLARCYLGASNTARDPDPITGFDAGDLKDLQLSNFSPSSGYSGPFPIFCATLNISVGEDLAWQERKAASFAFTPVLSGYHIPWTGRRYKGRLSYNGFVPTDRFAYRRGGIHISTVTAVSGAAVSPNWGYHTSAPMAFLLTMFNVRLGWWIANPRRSFLAFDPNGEPPEASERYPNPGFAASLLARELCGQVGDSEDFVYLTDGGHFDNMGLYELVRRRCYRILICDAEQDTGPVFEGIGMAIRKCRIDFGVEISLDLNQLASDAITRTNKVHWITGTIRYPETADEQKIGSIVYIKSSITGTEAADVHSYRLQNTQFPQDSTMDQWFTESQFESYRRLGQQVVDECPYLT